MGYYTNFKLKIPNAPDISIEQICEYTKYTGWLWDRTNREYYLNEAKWYDRISDMKRLSKAYPNAIFTINAKGEDDLDIWVEYWKNGKSQRHVAEIKFPPYNEEELS